LIGLSADDSPTPPPTQEENTNPGDFQKYTKVDEEFSLLLRPPRQQQQHQAQHGLIGSQQGLPYYEPQVQLIQPSTPNRPSSSGTDTGEQNEILLTTVR